MRRGVYVEKNRMKAPVEAMIGVLYRHTHINDKKTDQLTEDDIQNEKGDTHAATKTMEDTGGRTDERTEHTQHETNQPIPPAIHRKIKQDPGAPDGGDESSSSDKEIKDRPDMRKETKVLEDKSKGPPTFRENVSTPTDRSYDRGRGVTNIIKDYLGQPRFSGLYDNDLENIAEIYNSIADMWDATQIEKRKDMSLMLKGCGLSLFTRKRKGCGTFEEGINLLGTWFNSKDKQ